MFLALSRFQMQSVSLWGQAADVVHDAKDGELKFHDDNTADPFTVTDSPGVIDLSAVITQGTAKNERIGRLVNVTSVSCRGYYQLDGSSDPAATGHTLRFLVVVDTQANSTAWTDTSLLLTLDTPFQFHRLDHSARFVVLHDQLVSLNHMAGSWDGTNDQYPQQRHAFSVEIPNLCIPLEYSGSSGAITSMTGNAIYTVWLADVDNAVSAHVLTRLRYRDG